MTRAAAAAAALCAAVAGADEALLRVPAALAARVLTGEHSGLIVAVESDRRGPLVMVSQVATPLAATPPYPLTAPAACGDPEALAIDEAFAAPPAVARALAGCATALDALHAVVAFVTRNVAPDEADTGPQDAASVLRRARGRCSGRANAAVGLLRTAGIPARTVHGIVFAGAQPRWHRWGEAWLGPLGWLPFDPGTGAGVVSVRYLPCRAVVPGLQPQGVTLERVDDSGFDALPRRAGLRVPLVRGVNLRCRAPRHAGEITAVLWGPGGARWLRRGTGEVAFSGLLPAHYWLTWQAGGTVVLRAPLDLRRPGDVELDLSAAGGASS
jgi:hypothetical protein